MWRRLTLRSGGPLRWTLALSCGTRQRPFSLGASCLLLGKSIAATALATMLLCGPVSFASGVNVQLAPKEEAQQLVDVLLPLAESFLIKQNGEFFPFGAQLNMDGKIVHLGASDGTEHPPSNVLIGLMRQALSSQAKAGTLRCSAIAYDAKVLPPGAEEKTDAVVIELEHRSGYNVTVIFPYKFAPHRVAFSAPYAAKGAHHIFAVGS